MSLYISFPVRLNDRGDGYAVDGVDAIGQEVVFGDLLTVGDLVAAHTDAHGNCYGPFGTVTRIDGTLVAVGPSKPGEASA